MADTLGSKVHQYLLAREAAESAAKIAKELEEDIKNEMIARQLHRYEHEGASLILIQAERRTFDAHTLKDLVSSSVFKTVTAIEVRTKMFDAAAAVGMITEDVIQQVTTKIPYTQIRIGKHEHHGTNKATA
jgi:monoamine oxidase